MYQILKKVDLIHKNSTFRKAPMYQNEVFLFLIHRKPTKTAKSMYQKEEKPHLIHRAPKKYVSKRLKSHFDTSTPHQNHRSLKKSFRCANHEIQRNSRSAIPQGRARGPTPHQNHRSLKKSFRCASAGAERRGQHKKTLFFRLQYMRPPGPSTSRRICRREQEATHASLPLRCGLLRA